MFGKYVLLRGEKEMENSSIYKFEDKEYDESAIDEEGFQDFSQKIYLVIVMLMVL